jgi:hypothetical protein
MMHNEIINRLTVLGEDSDVKELMDFVLDKGEVSLKKIVPMPEEIHKTTSPSWVVSQERYDTWLEEYGKGFVLFDSAPITGEMQTELFFKYGVDNWKDWSVKYWGTIFDTIGTKILNNNQVEFSTCETTPFNALVRLSVMFPRVILKVEYADEDIGYNVGVYRLEHGQVLSNDTPEFSSTEAYSMSMDITGDYYYVEEFLWDLAEDEADEEFPKMCIEIAYEKRKLSQHLPMFILDEFERLAVKEEDYEFASDVQKAKKLKKVEI